MVGQEKREKPCSAGVLGSHENRPKQYQAPKESVVSLVDEHRNAYILGLGLEIQSLGWVILMCFEHHGNYVRSGTVRIYVFGYNTISKYSTAKRTREKGAAQASPQTFLVSCIPCIVFLYFYKSGRLSPSAAAIIRGTSCNRFRPPHDGLRRYESQSKKTRQQKTICSKYASSTISLHASRTPKYILGILGEEHKHV